TRFDDIVRYCQGGLERVIVCALEKSPKDRFATVDDFMRELRDFQAAFQVDAPMQGEAGPRAEESVEAAHIQSPVRMAVDDPPTDHGRSDVASMAVETVDHAPRPSIGSLGASARAPGDRIGRYELLELIEEDFEESWLARRVDGLEQSVMLKLIRGDRPSAETLRRLQHSSALQARCNHPMVERVLDGGTTRNGDFYAAVEFHRGVTILDFTARQESTLAARMTLLALVCDAIQAVHACGFMHRDIKPQNIRVCGSEPPLPKVVGFGVARQIGPDPFESDGAMIGTPLYMAPEQVECRSYGIDGRADIYALGFLLHELMAGVPVLGQFSEQSMLPLEFDTVRSIILKGPRALPSARLEQVLKSDPDFARRIAAERGVSPRGLVKALSDVVDPIFNRATQIQPEHRYQSPSEMARALRVGAERVGRPRRWFNW
ncbi:MAG: Serine/threonine-protein kinase PknB, partial [Pseudomonadota bacterium]